MSRFTAAAWLALSAFAVGCGRKATQADCDFIIDRYVELQMQAMKINDPVEIAKQKAEMRDMRRAPDCVGKRVTDGMLECVRRAQTNDEMDKCTH